MGLQGGLFKVKIKERRRYAFCHLLGYWPVMDLLSCIIVRLIGYTHLIYFLLLLHRHHHHHHHVVYLFPYAIVVYGPFNHLHTFMDHV